MIRSRGNHLTDLYTQNILGELFPEFCFSLHSHMECVSEVVETLDSVTAKITVDGNTFASTEKFSVHMNNRLATTAAVGKAVIKYASSVGKTPPPYGVLTGVRPFKIAVDLLSRYDYDEVITVLKKNYLIQDDKIELLLNAAMHDQMIRMQHDKNDASVYISVPFCPSRCNYCSFISSSAPDRLDMLDTYVDAVVGEIKAVSDMMERNGLDLKSVYIGGGTPTVLSAKQLEVLLKAVQDELVHGADLEFTVEAGRPDTVDEYKLDVMKKHGVTRTCINCQSTNNKILAAIGRGHTAEDYFEKMELAKSYCFDVINTDIIAGLENESFESFKKTVDDVIDASPDSITVHSLCVKKSSALRLNEQIELNRNIDEYIEYSKSACILAGFLPYYLYKQKYTLGNHENVGYCLHGRECYYNIAMMNEIEHIIGIGAGSTSRLVGCHANGKIEHFANYKYATEYLRDKDKYVKNLNDMEQMLGAR